MCIGWWEVGFILLLQSSIQWRSMEVKTTRHYSTKRIAINLAQSRFPRFHAKGLSRGNIANGKGHLDVVASFISDFFIVHIL